MTIAKRPITTATMPVAIYAACPNTPLRPPRSRRTRRVEPLVYNNLKTDFSSCDLPYSQALDVSRTYLHHFGSCRFEEMRTFRKCITEFALASSESTRRFPVVSPALPGARSIRRSSTWALLRKSTPSFSRGPCRKRAGSRRRQGSPGQAANWARINWTRIPGAGVRLIAGSGERNLRQRRDPAAHVLKLTCLSYCEFVELSKSGVPITLGGTQG